MAGTFPSSPGFRSVTERLEHVSVRSETINRRVQVRSLGVRKRRWTLSFPPMTRLDFEPIYDFVDLQDGEYGTFSITLPNLSDSTIDQAVTCRFNGPIQEFPTDTDNMVRFEVDIEEVV